MEKELREELEDVNTGLEALRQDQKEQSLTTASQFDQVLGLL